jgi:tyrosinase
MSTVSGVRVRRSIQDLQRDYDGGNKKPLEDVMRAWKGIKDLPPDDPNSFFVIGGYHGEPFRGAGWGNSQYWGGYCNHGNALFPTWHRMYLVRLEEAMRSIPGCKDVAQPFWDETAPDSLKNGVPSALTDEFFTLDNQKIPNPLRSFVFNKNIVDNISGDNPNYSKPKGYETVRYPLSGLVGNAQEQQQTKAHNALYPDYATNVGLLNKNIVNWLTSTVVVDGVTLTNGVADQFKACLNAPNYTVFSNTTSAAEWNDNAAAAGQVMPLEQPHNNIHLATGGFDVPGVFDASPISGANGDMGENDTAGLDPIFFFHHCFIDRVFWLWQKKHNATKNFDIIPEYPGTNSVDNQGPTPGVVPNSWLTLDSPLEPFRKSGGRAYTSRDCIDIESQLGYTYGPGSLDDLSAADASQLAATQLAAVPAGNSNKVVKVSGLNRAAIRGSFVIAVFAVVDGQRYRVAIDGVLSRWNVTGCANCQTHLQTKAFASLREFKAETAEKAAIVVEVHTRDGILTQPQPSAGMLSLFETKPFRVEVR